jgi:opacity protein-like surface antigen
MQGDITTIHQEVTMKRVLLTVTAMTLLMTGMAYAETETPVIDQRQANQEQRIDQGVASGQLNKREVNRLNKQQKHINKVEGRAKSDGVVTKKERARINKTQNRASRHLAREKHDVQGKRPQ